MQCDLNIIKIWNYFQDWKYIEIIEKRNNRELVLDENLKFH